MKLLRLTVACFALLAAMFAFGALAQEETGAPRFEDYRVAVRRGRVAPLDLNSHKLARHYRTLLRGQQRDEGVNRVRGLDEHRRRL